MTRWCCAVLRCLIQIPVDGNLSPASHSLSANMAWSLQVTVLLESLVSDLRNMYIWCSSLFSVTLGIHVAFQSLVSDPRTEVHEVFQYLFIDLEYIYSSNL